MPNESFVAFLRHQGQTLIAIADLVEGYDDDVPGMDELIPRSASTIGPLDIPTIYPASGDFALAKVDDEQGLVFGWASVAASATGELVVDSQDEVIEPADLERGAYDYVLNFAETGEMHDGPAKGRLVESLVLTPEKARAMGVQEPMHAGWWVGFKIDDPDVFEKVKAGEYQAFSIQGVADAEEVTA